jgi:mono/diheme cytochrome c family protein
MTLLPPIIRARAIGRVSVIVASLFCVMSVVADEAAPQPQVASADADSTVADSTVADSTVADSTVAEVAERAGAILRAKCLICHGAEVQEGGLRLDSAEAASIGGELGPAWVAGDVENSLIVRAIRFDDPDLQMPPGQKLSDSEIDTLEWWVRSGSAWPASSFDESGDDESDIGDAFTDPRNPIRKRFGGQRLDLWSLVAPKRREVPERSDHRADVISEHSDAVRSDHPVDAFIIDRLSSIGLTLAPPADRRTLIRRVTFDLTGLPPTVQEVCDFLADRSSDAYEKLVDRLLASPRYGERQARLWLDLVRYADTNGYERDEYRPLAWRYRDYVIRSFNNDKPFDRFIIEQLAGDESVDGLPESDDEADALIATGYLRLGQWDSTASIFEEEDRLRSEFLADLTNTTASAFLGMTMSCCQCHDHKYDPLSQADHFRLRAFFAGVTPQDDLIIDQADEVERIDAHNEAIEAQIETLRAERDQIDKDSETDKPRYEDLENRIAAFEAMKRQPNRTLGAGESGEAIEETCVLYQGDYLSPREAVEPGFPEVLYPGPASVRPPREATSGRRTALAEWIASPSNPWTGRVIVNRIWQQHFGTGLVVTANDFGYTGTPPTHPELLDHLAIVLVESGWSIKRLHRMIVTSRTYRQSSQTAAASTAGELSDADNRLYWRHNVRRLDAETIRDSLLAVTGLLLPYDSGKPLWPAVADELLKAQPSILEAEANDDGGRMQGWYTDAEEKTDVRSVFLVRKRCMPIPFLQAFDLPDTTVSCARRDTTVVAPQSLVMMNSPSAVRYATALADSLLASTEPHSLGDPVGRSAASVDASPEESLVVAAFWRALSREPDGDEIRLASELLSSHCAHYRSAGHGDESRRLAWVDLCRAILNVNEFLYID